MPIRTCSLVLFNLCLPRDRDGEPIVKDKATRYIRETVNETGGFRREQTTTGSRYTRCYATKRVDPAECRLVK